MFAIINDPTSRIKKPKHIFRCYLFFDPLMEVMDNYFDLSSSSELTQNRDDS